MVPLFRMPRSSSKTVENSERDGNTRPPDLPLKKFVCESGSNHYTISFQNIVAIMNIILPRVIGSWSTNDRKSLKWLTIWSHLSFYRWGNWGQERDKWSSCSHTQLTARVRIHSSLHSLTIVYWGPTKSQVCFGSWEYNGQKGKDLNPLAFTGLA